MSSLIAVPGWDSVPELETDTSALAGPGGPMNTQAQALLDRTEQLNPDNLPSRGGSYTGSEIFTMKIGTSWVQGNVSDLLQYLNSNVSVDLAQLQDGVNQAQISATAAATSSSSAYASAATASTAQSSATQSATSSSSSATLAQAWASQASGVIQGTADYSSLYYSGQSQYWAGISQAAAAAPTTWDPAYKNASINLTNGNITANFTSGQAVALGTVGYATGKHYFEITFTSGTSSGNASLGIAPATEPLANQIGYNDGSGAVGMFQSSGNIYLNGTKLGSYSGYSTVGNVVGVAVDSDQKLVWFRTNGGQWNGSGTANPSTGVGGIAYTSTVPMFPAVCTDSTAAFTANFTGGFAATIPAGFKSWASDSYHYVVPYATYTTPGIVTVGAGIAVDSHGTISVDSYYNMALVQANATINIDLTTPTPGYHVVLNAASASFAFSNLSLPFGKALRLTFYFEQGTGNNAITSWDSRIKWVGATPILAFTQGSRNVIEFETIDGTSFAGYYIGQIN